MSLAINGQTYGNDSSLGRNSFEELVNAFNENNNPLIENLGARWREIRHYVANELEPEKEEKIPECIRVKLILWLTDEPGSLRQDKGSRVPSAVLDADECQRIVMKHFWKRLIDGDFLASETSDSWKQVLEKHSKSLGNSSLPLSDVFAIIQVVDLSLENTLLQMEAETTDAYIALSVNSGCIELETSSKAPIELCEIANAVQQEVAIQPDLLRDILHSLFAGVRLCPDLLPSIDLDDQSGCFHLIKRETS
jgi:hypothetical protein